MALLGFGPLSPFAHSANGIRNQRPLWARYERRKRLSVLKSKRKESQFEVFHHLNKLRKDTKFYARYMDDSYAIHESKKYLEDLLADIIRISNEIGITINKNKTRICKLSDCWKFLQVRYSLTNTGRIVQKINPKRITVMRRKMKKLSRKMTSKEYADWFQSWYCGNKKFMSKIQEYGLQKLYRTEIAKCILSR